MTGCTTSGCLRATAVDAYSYNFKVVIPEECAFDRFESSHAINLFDLNCKYADVIPVPRSQTYLSGLPVRAPMALPPARERLLRKDSLDDSSLPPRLRRHAGAGCARVARAGSRKARTPTRPIRLIVRVSAGRHHRRRRAPGRAEGLALWGGKPIVVENKAGASGTIGTGESIAAAPDGYTLTVGNSQTHGTNADAVPQAAPTISSRT